MTIHAKCLCGKSLDVFDDLAGKQFECGGCGTMVPIPKPKWMEGAKPARAPSGDPEGSITDVRKRCFHCKTVQLPEWTFCRRCGWDGEQGRRCCVTCGGWVEDRASLPGGGGVRTSGVLGFFGLIGGLLGGLYAGVAFGAALAAAGCVVTALTLRFKCRECGKAAEPGALSDAEREEVKGRRVTNSITGGVLGLVSVAAFILWLSVAV